MVRAPRSSAERPVEAGTMWQGPLRLPSVLGSLTCTPGCQCSRPGLVLSLAFPPHPSGEESSSDETSNGSSPTLRRRRAKKRLVSSSESEAMPPDEQETELVPEPSHKHQFSSGLNRCIVLALVIAVSMGCGHFYGECCVRALESQGAVHPGAGHYLAGGALGGACLPARPECW